MNTDILVCFTNQIKLNTSAKFCQTKTAMFCHFIQTYFKSLFSHYLTKKHRLNEYLPVKVCSHQAWSVTHVSLATWNGTAGLKEKKTFVN